MKLAFCLFGYFPYGGLERDFLRIAKLCCARGHSVHVFTMKWEGEIPPEFKVTLIPVNSLTNHGNCSSFARRVAPFLKKGEFDVVVGFNRMPGLDIYYAADVCYEASVRKDGRFWYRMTPRYRVYSALERAVFGVEVETHIFLISEREKANFIDYYDTPESRFHLLPPGIAEDRVAPDNAAEIRAAVRREYQLGDDQHLLLLVASNYKRKGIDRSLLALASLPEELRRNAFLFVIGRDKAKPWQRMARRLGVSRQLLCLGPRSDVSRFLLGADVLLHPAYSGENTGTVLLEALASGLPVLATEVCGYAFHIKRAGAGRLVPSPYRQEVLNKHLERMLSSGQRTHWGHRGLAYSRETDLFSLVERAVGVIEDLGSRCGRFSVRGGVSSS